MIGASQTTAGFGTGKQKHACQSLVYYTEYVVQLAHSLLVASAPEARRRSTIHRVPVRVRLIAPDIPDLETKDRVMMT